MDPVSFVQAAAAWVGYRPASISLTVELTHLCNLACIYCDRHTPMPGEMTREQIFTALGEFLDMGTTKVNLEEGEPLAHRYVDEIVRWLTDRGISTHMNTKVVPNLSDRWKGMSYETILLKSIW